MIYPVRGKKTLLYGSVIGCAFVLVYGGPLFFLRPIFFLLFAALILFIFIASTRRDLRRWQYEIRGTDLLVTLPRTSATVPISTIERVTRTKGAARLWIGDVLQVGYVPGGPFCPVIVSVEES